MNPVPNASPDLSLAIASQPTNRLSRRFQEGKAGWILLWLLGVPLPILFLFYLLRGCT